MATNNSNGMLADYTQLNTIPAMSGILFALAAAVQFLDATFSLGIITYTFDPAHALLVSLGVLVVAFASSDTNDWRMYETYEQALVGLAVLLMVGAEYVTEVNDLLVNNSPTAGIIAFFVSMGAWGVLAR